jgi:hypothetical protein
VKFQLEVEDWDGKTEEAYAATTVVFAENKPEGVTDPVTGIHDPNSNFIYGQDLPLLATSPSLVGWFFLGYYDADGKKYYKVDLSPAVGVTWDKAGPACTLYAQWQESEWAGSNIYFKPDENDGDVGSLTFALSGTGKDGYQGLHFKWGSLIGVAAAGTSGNLNTFKEDTYLYIPDLNTGKYYKVKVEDVKKPDAVDAAKALYDYLYGLSPSVTWYGNGSDWNNIPYTVVAEINENYTEGNDDRLTIKSIATDLYPKYKGDICKFLSDKKATNDSGLRRNWVMPVGNKFSSESTDYTNKVAWDGTALFDGTDVDGTSSTTVRLKVYELASGEKVIFPAAGFRWHDNGEKRYVGDLGIYWSSSAAKYNHDYPNAGNMQFEADYARYTDNARYFGGSVRCVQE